MAVSAPNSYGADLLWEQLLGRVLGGGGGGPQGSGAVGSMGFFDTGHAFLGMEPGCTVGPSPERQPGSI